MLVAVSRAREKRHGISFFVFGDSPALEYMDALSARSVTSEATSEVTRSLLPAPLVLPLLLLLFLSEAMMGFPSLRTGRGRLIWMGTGTKGGRELRERATAL